MCSSGRINPILNVILRGVYDSASTLSALRGTPHLIQTIWSHITVYWTENVKFGLGNEFVDDYDRIPKTNINYDKEALYFNNLGYGVKFPPPQDICVNMMPYKNEKKFKKTKLPKEFRPYWDAILEALYSQEEAGKVWYLTIHESMVEGGISQRRPGLHTDSIGIVYRIGDEVVEQEMNRGDGRMDLYPKISSWGGGRRIRVLSQLSGGIYMASTVENTCRVWNCSVEPDIIGHLGDCEHLRSLLSAGHVMQKDRIYWLTDRTPHESLPMTSAGYRQYVRVVTSKLSYWYRDHATKNPNVKPDKHFTTVLKGSKFEGNLVVDDE